MGKEPHLPRSFSWTARQCNGSWTNSTCADPGEGGPEAVGFRGRGGSRTAHVVILEPLWSTQPQLPDRFQSGGMRLLVAIRVPSPAGWALREAPLPKNPLVLASLLLDLRKVSCLKTTIFARSPGEGTGEMRFCPPNSDPHPYLTKSWRRSPGFNRDGVVIVR